MLKEEALVRFLFPLRFIDFVLFLSNVLGDLVWLIIEKCAEIYELGCELRDSNDLWLPTTVSTASILFAFLAVFIFIS